MALVDLTFKRGAINYPGNFNHPFPGLAHNLAVRGRRFDCSQEPDINAGGDGVGTLLAAQTDGYKTMTLPKGAIPIAFLLDVRTAEGAADTLTVGDEADPDLFVTDFNLNATGQTLKLLGGNTALAATQRFTADEAITIKVSADTDAAIFDLYVIYVNTEGIGAEDNDT